MLKKEFLKKGRSRMEDPEGGGGDRRMMQILIDFFLFVCVRVCMCVDLHKGGV